MTCSPDIVQSKTIDWLRFAMAVAVVVIHTGDGGSFSPFPVYSTLSILTANGICRIAVPCFFIISGYLFFRHLETWDLNIWKSKMKRRFHSLLIPYLLWNIIAAIAIIAYSYFRTKAGSVSPNELSEMVSGWGTCLWKIFWNANQGTMPLDYPLWFMRDLILFTLVTPLVFLYCKYLKIYGILLLAILLFSGLSIGRGFWFFVAGSYMGIHQHNLVSSIKPFKWPALFISVLLLCSLPITFKQTPSLYSYLLVVFTLSGCICVFSFVGQGIERGTLKEHPFLTKSAFIVFALHGILILDHFARFIMLHVTSLRNDLYYCIDLFFRPLLTIGICLGVYWLLHRYLPTATRVLTGARA